MWGDQPAASALLTKDFFVEKGVKDILIPGIGYGRNVRPFLAGGIAVSGIEISKTAIALSKKQGPSGLNIHHGSVSDMPFDDRQYDGIFCHALIHLLDHQERKKLIQDCHNQLRAGGYMVFTAITKDAPNFGQGERISKDRYEFHKGAQIFYYDRASVKAEFERFGLFEITEVNENQPMFLIKCQKEGRL